MFREHVAALVTRGCAAFVTMLSERLRMPREAAAAAALQGAGPLCDRLLPPAGYDRWLYWPAE